jgi:hypothetical protein
MLIGYARVSTLDQKPALQIDALKSAGCERIFTEKASGAQRERPELKAALDYIREGDTLVVWKLDRLASSMRQLIETVEDLHSRVSSCARSPRASTRQRLADGWCSTSSARWLSSSAPSSASAPALASRPHASAARRAAGPERSAPKTLPLLKRCSQTPRSAWRMSRRASRFPRRLSIGICQVAAVQCWQRSETEVCEHERWKARRSEPRRACL